MVEVPAPVGADNTNVNVVLPAALAGLDGGTRYRFTVQAQSPAGWGAIAISSPAQLITTVPYPSVPLNASNLIEVSANRPTRASSVCVTGCGSSTGRAVDNNPLTSFISGQGAVGGEWWQVDLGIPTAVKQIFFQNRADCCQTRMIGIDVFVGDVGGAGFADAPRCTEVPFNLTAPVTLVNISGVMTPVPGPSSLFNCSLVGRYITVRGPIQLDTTIGTDGYINIAEFKAFAPNSCPARNATNAVAIVGTACGGGVYGSVCTHQCAPGFVPIAGATTALCNGESWTEPELVCALECPSLPLPDFASDVALQTLSFGDFNQPTTGPNATAAWKADLLARYISLEPNRQGWDDKWFVQNDVLQASASIGCSDEMYMGIAAFKVRDWRGDFTITTELRTDDMAGVFFLAADKYNMYRVYADEITNRVIFDRVVSGAVTMITDVVVPAFSPDVWQHLTVVRTNGGVFELFLNGESLTRTRDTTFLAGYAGVYAQTWAEFDDLSYARPVSRCDGANAGELCTVECPIGLLTVGPTTRTCTAFNGTVGWLPAPSTQPTLCTLQAPFFPQASVAVAENVIKGTNVGTPLVATIDSPDYSLAWKVDSTIPLASDGVFFIDQCSGQIKVRRAELDFERLRSYVLNIRAYVPEFVSTAYTIRNVTISILNVDEPPVLLDTVTTLFENVTAGSVVGRIPAWDPDNSTLTYRLEIDPAAGLFLVNSTTGEVTVDPAAAPGALNFERLPNAFDLVVRASQTDDPTLTVSAKYTIQLVDSNDAPFLTSSSILPIEYDVFVGNAFGTVPARDEDAGPFASAFTYTLLTPAQGEAHPNCLVNASNRVPSVDGTTAGLPLFTVNSATGALTFARFPTAITSWIQVEPPTLGLGQLLRGRYDLCVSLQDSFGGVSVAVLTVGVVADKPTVPVISSFTPTSGLSTGGGDVVTVTGSGFGTPGQYASQMRVWYGDDATGLVYNVSAANVTVLSATTLRFVAVPGLGSTFTIHVDIGLTSSVDLSGISLSYATPTISAVAGNLNIPTQVLGQRIRFTGSGFGPWGLPLEITLGPNAAGASFACNRVAPVLPPFDPDTVVECLPVEGAGADMPWTIRFGNTPVSPPQGSPSSDLVSYAAPVITSVANGSTAVDLYALSTGGNDPIVIFGSNFGPMGTSFLVQYGGTSGTLLTFSNCLQATGAQAHFEIRCRTLAGAGKSHAVRLTVAGVAVASPWTGGALGGLAYRAPVITNIPASPATLNANTEGGQPLLIEGTSFGPPGWVDAPIVTYGPPGSEGRYTAVGCSVTTVVGSPVERIECLTAPGCGRDHRVVASVSQQSSGPFAGSTLTYASPQVFTLSGPGADGADTRGAQDVVISGKNFGPAAGTGYDCPLVVTYNTRLENGPNALRDVVLSATQCAVTASHAEVTCKSAEAAGKGYAWSVIIDSQRSVQATSAYSQPRIDRVEYPGGLPVTAANVDGGEFVEVVGDFLGPVSFPGANGSLIQSVSYGPSGGEYVIPLATVTLLDHTRLRVRLPPGTGSNLFFRIQVADQVSASGPSATFSYAPVTIVRMLPPTAGTFSDRAAPTYITLVTKNLPIRDTRSRIGLLFGNGIYATTPALVIPQGEASIAAARDPVAGTINVTFPLPENGGGAELGVQIQVFPLGATVPSQVSVVDSNSLFTYLPPRVDDVILTRARFLQPANGSAPAAANSAANSDAVNCTFPENDPKWSCNDPNLNVLEIRGAHFTADPATLAVQDGITRSLTVLHLNDTLLGEIWLTADLWLVSWSHSRIVVFTPRAEGTLKIDLTSAGYFGQSLTQSVAFSFRNRNPEISAVVGGVDRVPTTGGLTPIDIEVSNLQGATDLSVTVGGRPVAALYDTNDVVISNVNTFVTQNTAPYRIRVFPPAGQGSGASVVVYRTVAGKVEGSNTGFSVNYEVPTVTSVSVVKGGVEGQRILSTGFTSARLNVPTDGSALVRVVGTNLGDAPTLIVGDGPATVPLVACAGTAGLHTCYEGTPPRGEGDGTIFRAELGDFGFRVQHAAGNQLGPAVRFGYEAPIVSFIVSLANAFPTRGGSPIQLFGTNFGQRHPSRPDTEVLVAFGRADDNGGYLACLDVVRVSHTLINCTLPEGSGSSLDARVSVAGVSNSSAGVLSYNTPSITQIDLEAGGGAGTQAWVRGAAAPVAALHGLSAGGDNMTIRGTDFGRASPSNCVLFAWTFRSTDASRVFRCNNGEDFLGEGEVDAALVVSWDHEEIVLATPRGLGKKDIELSIRGNTLGLARASTNIPRFAYLAPAIASLAPLSADTEGGDVMTVTGTGFGSAPRNTTNAANRLVSEIFNPPLPLSEAALLPTAYVAVVFHRSCVTDGRTLLGFAPTSVLAAWYGNVGLDSCTSDIISHEDGRIQFRSAPGIGANRELFVVVVDAVAAGDAISSLAYSFSYLAPRIDFFVPSVVYVTSGSPAVDMFGRYYGNEELALAQGWSVDERRLLGDVGGFACGNVRRRREDGETIINCVVDIDITPVGARNVSVTVAGQTGRVESTDRRALLVVCGSGYYGRSGETCRVCPAQSDDPARRGAECRGYISESGLPFASRLTYPRPLRGWYNLNSSDAYTVAAGDVGGMLSACPEGFQDGGRDVCIVPCDPADACLGDNQCAFGYTSKAPMYRCASCDLGFYKRAGECIKCPDSPAALFIGFILLIVFICGGAFQLNKKQVNIAVVSIGVDFFQVLAIFAQSRIKWPPVIKELLHVLSAFNLNIEIVAPECLIPDVNYKQKFWFIMLLPLSVGGLFGFMYLVLLAYKAVILGQDKKRIHDHAPALISSCLILIYMLYLYLTRTIFDVFNCTPTQPPDGYTYLSVVFERCGVPGGTQMTLMGFAIAGLAVYTAGYPVFLGYKLWTNREIVMEDQLLRAKGVGNDRLSGPRTFSFRLTFGRSYFQFKPDYCLWILAIILRKFFIAITAVIFNKNASFQMAACLLIMFVAYAAQVHVRPYMSPANFDDVLKGHVEASFTSLIHARLRANLANIETRGRKKARRNLINFEGKVDRSAILGVLTGWLFAYNTVEEIMLFAAVIVCLMGIMYQANELSTYYPESKDSVTAVVLIVIIGAILYFVTVLVTEMVVLYNEEARKTQLSRAASRGRAGSKGDKGDKDSSSSGSGSGSGSSSDRNRLVDSDGEINVGKLDTQMNPLFMSKDGGAAATVGSSGAGGMNDAILSQKDSPPTEVWRIFQTMYSDMQGQLAAAHAEISTLKRRSQMGEEGANDAGGAGADTADGDRNPILRAGGRKAQFAPRSSGAADAASKPGAGRAMASFSAIRKSGGRA